MVQKKICGSGKVQTYFFTQNVAFWKGAKVILHWDEKYVSLSNLVSLFILVFITLLIVFIFM
ncbi:hypothetical protein LguiB_001535 [Lonicera macranthoides]